MDRRPITCSPAIRQPRSSTTRRWAVVVSQHFGPRNDMPPYVAVPSMAGFAGGTGYLGSKFGRVSALCRSGGEGGIQSPRLLDSRRRDARSNSNAAAPARELVERHLRQMESDPDKLNTMDEFYRRAYSLVSSPQSQQAFSLADEPQSMLDLYGHDYITKARREPAGIGPRLLLARRLVEAGVRFVTVTYGAWDSHVGIKDDCLDKMPALDHAISPA